jgi:Lrp/AsnC family transcriptional regulator, leucine-responsive regulatory protein
VIGEDCWLLKVAVTDTVHLEEVLEQTSALGRTTTSIVLSSPVRGKPLLPPE